MFGWIAPYVLDFSGRDDVFSFSASTSLVLAIFAKKLRFFVGYDHVHHWKKYVGWAIRIATLSETPPTKTRLTQNKKQPTTRICSSTTV